MCFIMGCKFFRFFWLFDGSIGLEVLIRYRLEAVVVGVSVVVM